MTINHLTPPGFFRRRGPKGRIVFEPSEEVSLIHKEFLMGIGKVHFPDQCDCVRPHLKNRFFLKIDLRDAYDSVSAFDAEVILDLPFGDDWVYFFHQNGGLIQGAPASPALFNLYCCETLDRHLEEYSYVNCLTYTRYVDDLFFSSQGRIGKKRRWAIRDAVRKGGFLVNEKKTMLVDNKHAKITYVGMKIYRGIARPTREFLVKLRDAEEGSHKHKGLLEWKKRVLAVNT